MKLDRLIAILFVLINRDNVTAKELAEKFEVSSRTIYRDLDTLLYAGFPVLTRQGNQGGVSIDKDYKLDRNLFSKNELSSLLIGLNGLSSVIPDHSVTAAYEKVKALIPDSQDENLSDQFDQVFIDLMKWQEYGDIKEKLHVVRKGMKEGLLISFDYFDKSGNESIRLVEPYRLTLKEMNWYLDAYCTSRNDFRMFKMTRMANMSLTDIVFEKRAFTPRNNGREGWIKDRLFNIEVEFTKKAYDSIRERSGEANIERISDNLFRAKMPFSDDEYSYNMLLGYGTSIKCVEPEFVRLKLKNLAEDVAALYR